MGLFISAVWIAISKASRNVQKSNGDKIKKIESDSRFSFCPREYVLGGTTNRFPGIDTSLKTLKNGAFSLSRINIFLAQTIWCVWSVLFLFHSIYGIAIEENNRIQIYAVLFCLLSYSVFIVMFKRKTTKDYLRCEDYGEEFVFDIFLRLERMEANLNKVSSKKKLLSFFLDKYCALSYDLFLAMKKPLNIESYDPQWLEMTYHELFVSFRKDYITGFFDDDATTQERINSYIASIKEQINYWKNQLTTRFQNIQVE